MATKKWVKFPHANAAFDYAGAKLAKAWARLHAGDQEAFPDAKHVTAVLKRHPKLKSAGDAEAIATALQEAWRHFHRGEFQAATEAGDALGVLGATVANKAEGIYASYLAKDADKIAHFERCAKRAEAAIAALPDDANSHHFHAFALGRYSQCISITKALAQGLGGKIKESLTRALELAPKHAEAHTALGLYHAEIIDKIGAMLGGLTYGAKADIGMKHFQEALKLTPAAPIAHMEFGNGLLMMYGKKRADDVVKAFEAAIALKPADAMEALDIDKAKSELED
jgi:tetratricopeptide (TPR) repeat protein